jgi:hypothetical protein
MALTEEAEQDLFVLPPTPAGTRRKWRNRVAMVVVPVLVAGGVGWGVYTAVHSNACGPGVASVGAECVGVTAGDFDFNPQDTEFTNTEHKIRDEDSKVVASGQPYVTVALLSSMTWTATSALSRSKVIHQLEGAYVALDRVNNHQVTGDAPLIELLLANEGTNEDEYDVVVRQLAGMTSADHPLDAVIGMGVSSGATLLSAQELAKSGVLMIASNVTGDNLDGSAIPGFSRVSTSNNDDIAALVKYLNTRPDLHRTMLVHAMSLQDNADPRRADFYTTSLAKDFTTQLGKYATAPDEPFDPGQTSNSFVDIATNLCTSTNPPTAVLYAGREPDLPQFIHDLAQRPCNSNPITVLVGTDASNVVTDADDPAATRQVSKDMAAGRITVICPAWAAPQDWAVSPQGTTVPTGFPDFISEFNGFFTANGNFGTQLDDGYAIMTHDALLTAAKAIRLATRAPITTPNPAEVLDRQYHMVAGNTISGASGPLSFIETKKGNPSGKPVFVLELRPTPKLLATYTTP